MYVVISAADQMSHDGAKLVTASSTLGAEGSTLDQSDNMIPVCYCAHGFALYVILSVPVQVVLELWI